MPHTWCRPLSWSTVSSWQGCGGGRQAPWKNSLFSLHGPLAFALVVGGWMIADVPATNLLGPDPGARARRLMIR